MKKRPLVFVIINYNDAKTTEKLLNNVKDYKSISKIIVVDNHSSDDSYQVLKKWEQEHIKVICTEENKGFSHGLNAGCKEAVSIYPVCDIILSNADITIYSDENLKELQEASKKKEIGVLGPVVCQGKEISRGWKVPTPKQSVFMNLPVIGRKLEKKYTTYPEEHYQKELSYVDAVSGCFFLIKSEVLKEVGYFDEHVFLYYEENILACKLKKTPYKVAVYNPVLILHDHSVSVDKNMNYIKKFKILKQSQYYFEEKYNQASKMQLRFLKWFGKLTLGTIYIRVFLKGGLRK